VIPGPFKDVECHTKPLLLNSVPFNYLHIIFGAKGFRNGDMHVRNTFVYKRYRRTVIIFKALIQKVLDMYARAHKI
jgi:hypothetical protein